MRKLFAFSARLCSGGGELHDLRTFQIGRSFYSIRSFLRWDLFRRRRGCLLRDLTWLRRFDQSGWIRECDEWRRWMEVKNTERSEVVMMHGSTRGLAPARPERCPV